jgi:hypothetical protein
MVRRLVEVWIAALPRQARLNAQEKRAIRLCMSGREDDLGWMWAVAQMLDSTAGRRCGHASIREREQLGRGNFLLHRPHCSSFKIEKTSLQL